MILVDTSVWIDHFRERDDALVGLLQAGRVATCAVVRAELRLGSGVPVEVAALLARIPNLPVPNPDAALSLLDRLGDRVTGAGIGFADLLLLGCALDAGCPLRTSDRRRAAAWEALGFQAG